MWSGRLDPAELHRPGGRLIAALVQCAHDRGLTLHEMAAEMEVSYWDISQLRLGFRPLKALDDGLADACAVFLGLPRLTVRMLAGLLDPEAALQSGDVTAEDIVHALDLAQTDAADLVLRTDLNRQRPLQGLAVDTLARLMHQHGGNPAVLDALRSELRHRPPSKTEQLRAAVDAALKPVEAPPAVAAGASNDDGDARPAPGIMRCASCQTRLRIPHLPEPGEIRCPSCRTEYHVQWEAAVCVVQRQWADDGIDDEPPPSTSPAPAAPLTTAQARALLGVAVGSPWDEVERARRSLLQHYHPDKLGHISPLVRALAVDAFKRVNDAYDLLRAARR